MHSNIKIPERCMDADILFNLVHHQAAEPLIDRVASAPESQVVQTAPSVGTARLVGGVVVQTAPCVGTVGAVGGDVFKLHLVIVWLRCRAKFSTGWLEETRARECRGPAVVAPHELPGVLRDVRMFWFTRRQRALHSAGATARRVGAT